jgi:hypothetical protein
VNRGVDLGGRRIINTNTLAPGDHTTFAGTYALSQPAINAGAVSNSATATGPGPAGDVDDTDTWVEIGRASCRERVSHQV